MALTKNWLTIAAILGGLGVILGAFGAHGFDSHFAKKYAGETRKIAGNDVPASMKYLDDYKTGVRYHMWHVLPLLVVGLLGRSKPSRALNVAGYCFLFGIVLFSGSLYLLTLLGLRWLGMVAPIGGTLLIVGWFALATAACGCHDGETS